MTIYSNGAKRLDGTYDPIYTLAEVGASNAMNGQLVKLFIYADNCKNDKTQVLFHSSTLCADYSEVNALADERLNDKQQCTEPVAKSLPHEEPHQVGLNDPSQLQLEFGSELPRLVASATSTFGWNCTKGCSWFPAGDRLLVPCEDARSDHIRGQNSHLSFISVYGFPRAFGRFLCLLCSV